MAAILIALTLTVVFQDSLNRRRRLHQGVRYAFLGVVLGWLGLMVGGQLTIVNIINYVRAPFDNLPLEFYLRDPLLVIIVVYTLGSVIVAGEGESENLMREFPEYSAIVTPNDGRVHRLLS